MLQYSHTQYTHYQDSQLYVCTELSRIWPDELEPRKVFAQLLEAEGSRIKRALNKNVALRICCALPCFL